jgi:hypothetical protein
MLKFHLEHHRCDPELFWTCCVPELVLLPAGAWSKAARAMIRWPAQSLTHKLQPVAALHSGAGAQKISWKAIVRFVSMLQSPDPTAADLQVYGQIIFLLISATALVTRPRPTARSGLLCWSNSNRPSLLLAWNRHSTRTQPEPADDLRFAGPF